MTNITFFSLTKNTNQTLTALGLADALVTNGNTILFLNINFDINKKILEPFCEGNFIDYVNKKNKLNQITTRLHFLNLDLITFFESDVNWLNTIDALYLGTIVENFFKQIINTKKYDFLIVNGYSNEFNELNKALIKNSNFLILPTNSIFVDQESFKSIYSFIKLKSTSNGIKKTFILFTEYQNLLKNSIQTVNQLKLAFPKLLVDYYLPKPSFQNNELFNDEKKLHFWFNEIRPTFLKIIYSLKIDKLF